jgi:hypothetical protein
MRTTIIILFINLSSIGCYCQNRTAHFTIAASHGNTVWAGYDNPMMVVVENTSCDSILISTNNGIIKIFGKDTNRAVNCWFGWDPSKLGEGTIFVNKITSRDTIIIGSEKFKVINFPDPEVYLGSTMKSGGVITKDSMQNCGGLAFSYHFIDVDITGPDIKSYCVIVIRNKNMIYYKEITGMAITKDALEFFKTLEDSDTVIFSKIVLGSGFSDYKRLLKPIEFYIKN